MPTYNGRFYRPIFLASTICDPCHKELGEHIAKNNNTYSYMDAGWIAHISLDRSLPEWAQIVGMCSHLLSGSLYRTVTMFFTGQPYYEGAPRLINWTIKPMGDLSRDRLLGLESELPNRFAVTMSLLDKVNHAMGRWGEEDTHEPYGRDRADAGGH